MIEDYLENICVALLQYINRKDDTNMKRKAAIAIVFLLVSFAFSACGPATSNGQVSVSPSASAEISGNGNTSTPEFLNDIGKTLIELKNEHPEGELIVRPGGFPDNAAVCFGEPEAEFAYYFFGTQGGDAEKAMSECEDQLKCAGFLTTADILFPDMENDMSFEDFFSLIGVDDYEYLVGEEVRTGEGWLIFMYRDMEVMVNTNEITPGGGWNFTGEEIVKRNAPVSIADPEISNTNQDIADAVMFDEAMS